jgi:putative salt-induced outer membrane protein
MKGYAWIAVAALLSPLLTLADEAPPPPNGVWTGKGQLGFVASQGNTDAKSANAMLDAGYVDAPWKHALHLEGLYGKSADVVSAERWQTLWQSNYDFTPRMFAFGGLRYDHDEFSGFQYQGSITGGVGYNIFNTKTTQLSVQLGAGYRVLRPEDIIKDPVTGAVLERTPLERTSGAIGTGGVNYSQALTATTTISDKLTVESGSLNTLLTNALALTVKMTDKLALSLGYSLENNSRPPGKLKNLDTTETLNVVFGF